MVVKKTIRKLLDEINNIKHEYDKEREKDRFNIFYALHKEHDEVNLHSRFISYLLAPDDSAGHGQGNLFAKLFFEFVLKIDDQFLEDYIVIPNEFNKTEFEEIDILLINKENKHAIIIENKIHAKDSIHEDKKGSGYSGQLERYYNTIKKGKYISENRIEPTKYTSKEIDIDVFYLALKKPEDDDFKITRGNIPENVRVDKVYYGNHIVKWLEECILKVNGNDFLKKIINQYLILVKNMTKTNFNNEEILEIKKIISYSPKTAKYLMDNFNHVKWHTVHQFWMQLQEELINEKKYEDVKLYAKGFDTFEEGITKLTHHNENINLGVTFSKNEETIYISALNILSWGLIGKNKWKEFNGEAASIIFSDFSKEKTFSLIKEENSDRIIKEILTEIKEGINNEFKNLTSI